MTKVKLAISIPTSDRPQMIEKLLSSFYEYNIQLLQHIKIYIFDSSSDRKTEIIINNYLDKLNLYYLHYDREITISEKTLDCYFIPDEDYIWLTADRRIPTEHAIDLSLKLIQEYNFIIYNDFDFIKSTHAHKFNGLKVYNDHLELYNDCFSSIGKYGIVLINRREIIINNKDYFIEKYENHIFSYYALYFENLQDINLKGISIPCNAVTEIPIRRHWDKVTITLWAKEMDSILKMLPSCYAKYNNKVHSDHMKLMGFDQLSTLCVYRVKRILNKRVYIDSKECLEEVLKSKSIFIKLVAYSPILLCYIFLVLFKIYEFVIVFFYKRMYRSHF